MELSIEERDKIINWILRSSDILKENKDKKSLELTKETQPIIDILEVSFMDYCKNNSDYFSNTDTASLKLD